MGQPISWSGDYVKDTQDMLTALGTFEKMGIIHEDWVNDFYYGLVGEFGDCYDLDEFEDSLWELVEKVDEKCAKRIAETLREKINDFLWKR